MRLKLIHIIIIKHTQAAGFTVSTVPATDLRELFLLFVLSLLDSAVLWARVQIVPTLIIMIWPIIVLWFTLICKYSNTDNISCPLNVNNLSHRQNLMVVCDGPVDHLIQHLRSGCIFV